MSVSSTSMAPAQRASGAPAWKRRFRAPVVMFPTWVRERPERLVYLSNAGGKFEVHAWDQRTEEKRQVTGRAGGTGYRVSSRLDPLGEGICGSTTRRGTPRGSRL